MSSCTPVYALIYIYGLRHTLANGQGLSTQAISETFHILETDVLNAWKYWDDQGLIKMDTQNEGMSIEFLPFPEQQQQPVKKPLSKPVDIMHPQEKPLSNAVDVIQPPTFNLSLRPQYTPEELAFYKNQSEDVANLYKHGEQTLAKMLAYHDMNILFGFYDWLRLPMDVIFYMMSYCAENGHRDLRYIEKVALDWAERSINTVETAKDYVQTFDKDFREIMRALGNPSAFPSPTQRKFMQKWLEEMEIPLCLILEACDRSAVQLGKPNLKYVHSIVEAWYNKGIKTLEEVDVAEADWHKEESDKKRTGRPVKRRNRFANFKPREKDFAQLEKMEREYLMKSIEG